MNLEGHILSVNERGEGVHMPHVYYGDPTPEFSVDLIRALMSGSGDILEFGIPYSDPVADGPTFQGVCKRALDNGVTPGACLSALRQLTPILGKPVVLTTYYNVIYSRGLASFVSEAKRSGASGLLVPDLPLEEAGPLLEEANRSGVSLILQVAPTTSEKRMKRITEAARGFIYVVNAEGVTGARSALPEETSRLIQTLRALTDTPLIAGFGVSGEDAARRLTLAGASGVAAGSVYADIYLRTPPDPRSRLGEVTEKAREVKRGANVGVRMRYSA